MNMLLCRPERIEKLDDSGLAQCIVDDVRRVDHIRNILKLKAGDECKAGILNLGCCQGRIRSIEPEVVIDIDMSAVEAPPKKMPLTLFIAMQRPNTLKKVIHCAVTMGVSKICFFGSYKVEKSYWQSSVLQEKNLQFELDLAMEQCKDPMEPEIIFDRYFKSFTENILSAFVAENPVFVAHPDDRACGLKTLGGVSASHEMGLVVGPEGGFTDYEIGRLREMNIPMLSLGDRVLRTEFALAALLEIFNLHCHGGLTFEKSQL